MLLQLPKLMLTAKDEVTRCRVCIVHCSIHAVAVNCRRLQFLQSTMRRPTSSDFFHLAFSPTSSTSSPSTSTCSVYELSLAPSLRSTRPASVALECGHRSW